jgi:ABC-type transport system substrate-binding protein
MNSKYVVFALAFLLTFSATSVAYASTTGIALTPSQVDTHGPRINAVLFSVISSDASLESSLSSGTIQAAEWTFTVGSFNSMASNPSVYENSTIGYTWEGIAFNTVHPYMNNVHYRQAIAYLTDYSYIQTTVLSGVAGTATPDVLPVAGYGFMAGNEPAPYAFSTTSAAAALIAAHLFPCNGGTPATATTAGPSTTWYVASGCTGTVFSPTLQYRSDDPLRTGVALGLIANAAEIGLVFNVEGIAGSGGRIYGPSIGAVISPGLYNSTTGYNSPPVVNAADANSSADAWDMYTYGWVTSDNFEAQAEFWNSAFMGSSINFVNFYNRTMDYYSNAVLYATTIAGADAAAINIAKVEMQQLPYLNSYFENTLFADFVQGWTGYANEPTVGPNTGGGIYYTLLNVHPTNTLVGGTLNYAVHEQADSSGMNPIYNTNWVWQADLWGEVYDTPLATPPTLFTTVNSFLNYMTTSYSVAPYTGKIPGGSFYFQAKYETATTGCGKKLTSPCYYTVPKAITNGETVTFNFAKNITFTDGVPFTAKDYQFSLYIWDLAVKQTTQADVETPDTGLMTGPSGLIASHVTVSKTVDSITIYINSNSVWNLADVVVPVMPQHLLQYFNPDHIATGAETLDTTLPYVSDVGYLTASTPANTTTHLGAITVPKAPKWVTYEPNMEVGTGPFALSVYSETTGAGELTANVNYFRSAWYADINATTNTFAPNHIYTNNFTISMYIYNPTSATYCGVAAGTNGYCGITGKVSGASSVKTSKVVTLEYCTTAPVGTGPPTNCTTLAGTYNLVQYIVKSCTPTGTVVGGKCPKGDKLVKTPTDQYVLTLPTTTMAAGYYEVILQTSFSFQGLSRTWYQATGFALS